MRRLYGPKTVLTREPSGSSQKAGECTELFVEGWTELFVDVLAGGDGRAESCNYLGNTGRVRNSSHEKTSKQISEKRWIYKRILCDSEQIGRQSIESSTVTPAPAQLVAGQIIRMVGPEAAGRALGAEREQKEASLLSGEGKRSLRATGAEEGRRS